MNLPLKNIKVLDMTRVLAGPWATMSLSDLGAEVWKIENVVGGDDTRAWSVPNYKGVGTYYLCANRGKHSLAIDLKAPEGREIIHALAAEADIVVENFRPGTMERLGLGYDVLRSINPRLIYCSISGYGQIGPERDRPGYDFVMQAESGLMSITGEKSGNPNRLGVAFTDVVAGMVATQSILAALYQRNDTGEGQSIDVTLLESTLNLLINVGTGYLNAGVEATRYGNAHPSVVPYQMFQCEDGAFALAVGTDRMFRDFCSRVIMRPEMGADPRFVNAHQRAMNRDELLEILAQILSERKVDHWLELCGAASVPAGRVNSVSEALATPSIAARGIIQTVVHDQIGDIRLIKPAHGLHSQEAIRPKAPPMLGEDTRYVLSEVLRYDAARIDALASQGVIGCYVKSDQAASV